MKLILFGYGKMGKLVEQFALSQRDEIVSKISSNAQFDESIFLEADACIDFSSREAVLSHVELACHYKKPLVIGTTGWEDKLPDVQKIVEKSETCALYSPNFSLGVHAFLHLLKFAKSLYPQYSCSGVETHHSQKKDAPSGTAKAIAQVLDLKTEFTSIRTGNSSGKHEILFDSALDSIQLVHEAKNRDAFAKGALTAASWLIKQHQSKQTKKWYTIDDLTRSLYSFDHPL